MPTRRRDDICDNRCNNFDDPCSKCVEAAYKEEQRLDSRSREASIARRVVLAQNGIIEAALDLATRPPRR